MSPKPTVSSLAQTLARLGQDPLLIRNLNTPVFAQEGPSVYAQAAARNRPFARPGPELTTLPVPQESAFRQWVAQRRVPFDPNERTPDYDMRGYYAAATPQERQAWSPGQHFPDTFKTIRDATFSNESKYALPQTPYRWVGNNLVDTRTNQLVFGHRS